ncbi:MAG: adenosylcobinamide-phosphate synthase CbiB [Duncaniella sp.]|nr:adenosylcobinamide-phosphate synthase CbiB [Duncaniella sp.]MDE6465863.1 adenosylcobinamide-phosphate synthase CbiB [Duncaniella sp.]
MVVIVPLLTGWCMDLVFGDPARLPHPVVGFGRCISFFEHRLNRGPHRVAKGAFTAVTLVLAVFFLTWLLLRLLAPWTWALVVVESLAVFYCLAGTTLAREVRMVFEAADRSLDEGRRQVARIVGRDTASLSDREVRVAALETLAENLSDGVIAPLFWFALLGVPGMMAYKMVNTIDSMVGYRNDRYRDFGRWGAKIDDVANYIPARLTAFLMIMVAGKPGLWKWVRRFGRCHASPNSGYPEAALAGILDCRFGGTHDYFGEAVFKPYIGINPRVPDSSDMEKAISVNRRAEVVMVLLAGVVRTLLFLGLFLMLMV